MKPPKSRKAELAANATGGEKSHAETAESAEFKMTELGPIPKDWEVKRLGEVVTIQLGKMIDAEKNIGVEKYYISNRDVHWGHIDVSQLHRVRMTDSDLIKYNLQKGDLLVCEGGEVGRSAIWEAPIEDCYFQKTLHRIRFNNNTGLTAPFLLELLRRYAEIGFFDAYVAKTSIAHLPKDKIEILPIVVPPLAEQRRIAAALSDVDELISALGKLIEKKRNIKTGTMQQFLTGKNRLPGFGNSETLSRCASVLKKDTEVEDLDFNTETQRHGGTEFKMTELGPIPKDWEVKRLGEIVEINPPCFKCKPTRFVYVDLEAVKGGKLLSRNYMDLCDAPSRAQRLFAKNDILYQTVRPYQCNNMFVDFDSEDYIASTGYAIIRANKSDARYVYVCVCSNGFVSQVLANCTGTSYPAINPEKLADIKISVPPTLAEQKAIATVLSDMDAEIAALEADRAKYERIKSGMMQELLTGRTRLKGE